MVEQKKYKTFEEFAKDVLYIVDATVNCKVGSSTAIVPNINDAGVKYFLNSDPLCNKYEHRRYPLIKSFSLLHLENLSDRDFCVNYITTN